MKLLRKDSRIQEKYRIMSYNKYEHINDLINLLREWEQVSTKASSNLNNFERTIARNEQEHVQEKKIKHYR